MAEAPRPLSIKLTWAQRMRTLLLTCAVVDATDVEAVVSDFATNSERPSTVVIRMRGPSPDGAMAPEGGGPLMVQYEETLTFYDAIDPSKVFVHAAGRNVYIRLTKHKGDGGGSGGFFWPRLLKDGADQKRRRNITVDWGLWKDEDDIAEEAEEEEFASIGAFRAFTMSNGVNVNGGGDPNIVAKMLNPDV